MIRKSWILIFIFIMLPAGISAVRSAARETGRGSEETKKVVINIREMGEKMGPPTEEILYPDGVKWKEQKWDSTHIQQAIAELRTCFDDPETTWLLTDSPAPWITLALLNALKPLNVLYLYPREGGAELDMGALRRGAQTPNYDVAFQIVEEGDDIFINLNSDRPEAETLVRHTFDLDNLPQVAIPDIPPGRNVFIHGKGMFCVLVRIANNYAATARSVSLAAHDSDYFCAVSRSGELEIGEMTKRNLPNNL